MRISTPSRTTIIFCPSYSVVAEGVVVQEGDCSTHFSPFLLGLLLPWGCPVPPVGNHGLENLPHSSKPGPGFQPLSIFWMLCLSFWLLYLSKNSLGQPAELD